MPSKPHSSSVKLNFDASKIEPSGPAPNTAQTPVVKGENVDQAPLHRDTHKTPSNRSQTGGSNDNSSLPLPPEPKADIPPPPPAPRSNPEPEVDLTTFPVPVLRDMHAFIRTSVYETEETLAHAATLGAASALVARYFVSPTKVFSNIYLVCLGDSGVGKEVLRKGFTQISDHLSHRMGEEYHQHLAGLHGTPQSGIALHKRVADRPNDALIMTEFGDDVAKWINQGPASRYIISFLKEQYGQSQSGSLMNGAAYSAHENSVDSIKDPSLTVIGGGVPQPWFETMRDYGLSDGFAGRFLFVEAGKQYIDDIQSSGPPEELLTRLHDALKFTINEAYPLLLKGKAEVGKKTIIPPQVGAVPNKTTAVFTIAAETILRQYRIEIRDGYRRNDDRSDDQKSMARSLHENAQRIALTLAAWDYIDHRDKKRGLVIDERHAAWAVAYVRQSHELVERHMRMGEYSDIKIKIACDMAKSIFNLLYGPEGYAKGKARQAARKRGIFTLGILPNPSAAMQNYKTRYDCGLELARDHAARKLISADAIEYCDGTHRHSPKPKFRLGGNWQEFLDEHRVLQN